jgi:hypothetical protein
MAMIGLDHVQPALPRGGEERVRAFYCEVNWGPAGKVNWKMAP